MMISMMKMKNVMKAHVDTVDNPFLLANPKSTVKCLDPCDHESRDISPTDNDKDEDEDVDKDEDYDYEGDDLYIIGACLSVTKVCCCLLLLLQLLTCLWRKSL